MKLHVGNLSILWLASVLVTACSPAQAELNTAATQAAADTSIAHTALAPTSSSTPLPTSTATPIPPSATPLPTATPNLAVTNVVATRQAFLATRQAEYTATAIVALSTQRVEDAAWSQLVNEGTVSYSRGELTSIDDLEDNWAQRLWYRWYPFGLDLSDFVIMTHIEWKYPDDVNILSGGCGFVMRLKDNDNHLYTGIDARSRVFLGLMTPYGVAHQNVSWEDPAVSKYSAVLPPTSGSADLWLVAENEFVTAYVNGMKTTQFYVAATNSGDIGYTILSGTNNEPGTNCKFTNTRIWELVKN